MIKLKIKKKYLTEADVSDTADLSAIKTIDKNHDVIILLSTSNFDKLNPQKNIIGIIKFIKASKLGDGECNKAYNITSSFVVPKYENKGYGKLLYKLAASSTNFPIIPDRINTSPKAQNIWNSFLNSQNEFKIVPLKNCTMVEEDSLNNSFLLKNSATYKSMLEEFMSRISLDEKEIKNILTISTKMFKLE